MTVTPLLAATRAGINPARLYAANAEAVTYYMTRLDNHEPALAYLRRRGLAAAAAASSPWQLGYSPAAWWDLTDHLRGRGFTNDELYAAGLATYSRSGHLRDRFRDRIVFPIHDLGGRTVGFTARDLSGGAGVPRYLNTPETPIYRKSHLLYGLGPLLAQPPARTQRPRTEPPLVIVVEGATDTIAVWHMAQTIAALPGTVAIHPVATCGTTLTAEQLRLLRAALPNGARLATAFDHDHAGRRALIRTYPLLRHWPGPTYAITLPAGSDPADLLVVHGATAGLTRLIEAMSPAARTAMTTTLDMLRDTRAVTDPRTYPADRARAIEAIAGYFIDDPADLAGLAEAAAGRLGLTDIEVAQAVIAHTFCAPPPPR